MTRICVLEQWKPEIKQWRVVAYISDLEVAERWRRNGEGRKYDQRMCYTGPEFLELQNWSGEDIPKDAA